MKKLIFTAAIVAITLFSCGKNKCHECHYDKAGTEVELGEKCGDELETLEANGYVDATGTYEVHCHEH
jgi:hypothetical protein